MSAGGGPLARQPAGPAGLRRPAGVDLLAIQPRATGFIPQQDKGYLVLNVQLPDSASVERTQRIMARIESMARDTPGVAHTVGISGQSLIAGANAPNLGSMYVMLDGLFRAPRCRADRRRHLGGALDRCRREVKGAIVTAFGAPPIDGLGTTGGFKLIVEDRGNLGIGALQRVADQIVARGNRTRGCTACSTAPAPIRPGSAWRSTAPSA